MHDEIPAPTITLKVTPAQADLIAAALHRMEMQEGVARSVALAKGAEGKALALELRIRGIQALRQRIDEQAPHP